MLIVDDFLATGETLLALARLIKGAGANFAGAGIVVEKTFEGGRERLRQAGHGGRADRGAGGDQQHGQWADCFCGLGPGGATPCA